MAVAADLSRGEEGGCHSTPTFLCYTQVSMKSGVSRQPSSWKGSVNRRLTKVAMTLSRKIENVRSQVDLSINGWISPRRLSERSSKSLFGQGFTRIRADIVGKQPRNQRNSAQIRVLFFLSDSLLAVQGTTQGGQHVACVSLRDLGVGHHRETVEGTGVDMQFGRYTGSD